MHRDTRSFRWVDDLGRDLAYGVRALARTPGFTAVAMITLALGISAVTVIYSVLRNVVLDPFPYSRSDRMVNVLLLDGTGRRLRGPYFPASEFLDSTGSRGPSSVSCRPGSSGTLRISGFPRRSSTATIRSRRAASGHFRRTCGRA